MAQFLPFAALALFAAAAVTDLRSRRVPNELSLALAGLALVRIGLDLAAGEGLASASGDVVAGAGVLVLGALAFHLNLLGGGDVKLIAAGALWFGLAGLGGFLLATAVAGGFLALAVLGARLALPRGSGAERSAALPYAVAIATGAVLTTAWMPSL